MTQPEQSAQVDHSVTDKVVGVFSTTKIMKVGTGATVRKTAQMLYYYAAERGDGIIELQPLSTEMIPTNPKIEISKDELLNAYTPEPEIYQKQVLPKMREVQKMVARGDRLRKRGETFSAEYEFNKALKIDEQNVRANFGIGLCYLDRGEQGKAHDVFERLVKLDAAFEKEHKHLFNDFGISLRKNKMHDEAMEYYRKALELTADDENLQYNMARACFELGKFKEALEHLHICVKMNPDHEEAKKFIYFVRKKVPAGK